MYRNGPVRKPSEGCFGQNRWLAGGNRVEAKRESIDTLGRRSGNRLRESPEESVWEESARNRVKAGVGKPWKGRNPREPPAVGVLNTCLAARDSRKG